MLLVNKTLLKMSKGIRGWIVVLVAIKMVILVGTANFAQAISGYLGSVLDPQMSADRSKAQL